MLPNVDPKTPSVCTGLKSENIPSLSLRTNYKQGSALQKRIHFFPNVLIFPSQNKKYNCVSSSISQNMMNEQSRTIYIFCRIFLMSWILPKSRHASCVSFYYNWAEITQPMFLCLDSSGFYFCLYGLKTTTKTKETRNKIHTRVQLGSACFQPHWRCFLWNISVP